MAKYSYNELRSAATAGRRIGGWKGLNVYACSKYNYDPKQTKAYYVIYDDGNALVRGNSIYGAISDTGVVDEWDICGTWKCHREDNKKVNSPTEDKRSVPASAYSAYMAGASETSTDVEVPIEDFFLRIDREINELLANASKIDLTVSFGEDANS